MNLQLAASTILRSFFFHFPQPRLLRPNLQLHLLLGHFVSRWQTSVTIRRFFPRAIVFPFAESKQGKDGTGGRCEDRKRIGPDAQIVIPHLATQPRGFSGCR